MVHIFFEIGEDSSQSGTKAPIDIFTGTHKISKLKKYLFTRTNWYENNIIKYYQVYWNEICLNCLSECDSDSNCPSSVPLCVNNICGK